MKIETLTNLVRGELLNRPFISEVTFFTDEVEKVSRGSCFFSNSNEEIKEAVKKGAYAIISENEVKIIDKEIAWILTPSIKQAIFDIFRYENIESKIYFTDRISADIIKKMSHDKRVIVLENEKYLLKALNTTEKYLITTNEKFKNVFKDVEEIEYVDINIEQISLFKSKINQTEINLPFVYKNNFAKAFNFFEKNNLKYTLEFNLDRFKPIFVNSFFEKVEYGKSDRVLITGIKNDELFFDELNYLIENTRYAKTVIVGKNNRQILKEYFNFAMLVDIDVELKQREEKGLF